MITKQRVDRVDCDTFRRCWELYCAAFPECERRDEEYQKRTLQRDNYSFYALWDGDCCVGFISVWEFEDVAYIEHFAIFEAMRGGGYGRETLTQFIKESKKPILLEVEHPDTEIAARRIEFYRELGFSLNDHKYEHPPYQGDDFVSLLIMTYPSPISEQELEQFKKQHFPAIHFEYF